MAGINTNDRLFVFTASDARSQQNLQKSILHPIKSTYVLKHLSREIIESLKEDSKDGDIYAWGSVNGQNLRKIWEKMEPGDYILTYQKKTYICVSRILKILENPDFGDALWGKKNGESFSLIYFLDPPQQLDHIPFEDLMPYVPQYRGLQDVPSERIAHIKRDHGSISKFLEKCLNIKLNAPETPSYWWVNQRGGQYKPQRNGGFIWAPLANDRGNPFHWANVGKLKPGDKVIHYNGPNIRATSTVIQLPEESGRPPELAENWDKNEGFRVTVKHTDIPNPIHIKSIPDDKKNKDQNREQDPSEKYLLFDENGDVNQGYLFGITRDLWEFIRDSIMNEWRDQEINSVRTAFSRFQDPAEANNTFEKIKATVLEEGLIIEDRTLRRYHASISTPKGFVILSGTTGTGKTWLAQAYAKAVKGEQLLVPVAPNWTANEDLLGYESPLDNEFHGTSFSDFLQEASDEWKTAKHEDREPKLYFLILDEMNLARIEHYFALFLSQIEVRDREETATIDIGSKEFHLTPNLKIVGTVNVDETATMFSDKVYDRSQLIEIPLDRERIGNSPYLKDQPYKDDLLQIWDAVHDTAPFAFRVCKEIKAYWDEAQNMGASDNEIFDEQLLQKVLPKIKGMDTRVKEALENICEITNIKYPLTNKKAQKMLDIFNKNGFTSYFA